MKKFIYIFLIAFLFMEVATAQTEDNPEGDTAVDDLGDVSDDFQEYFYEAITQRAIENYEKAIVALQKAEKIKPLPVIFFEFGKNYKALEQYDLAVENFLKAHKMEPENKDILAELYDVYHLQKDYPNAIDAVKKLIVYDPDFSEDLANLYLLTEQYEKALAVLDSLDAKLGNSDYRDSLRRRIYAQNPDSDAQISVLKKRIAQEPQEEQNYLNLIYVYSESGKDAEAFETAQQLIKQNPDSELAHLALYKFYLDQQQTEEAIQSMGVVFNSEIIDTKIKLKVLNDFILFVKENEAYKPQLQEMINLFGEEQEGSLVYAKLADFYLLEKDLEQALNYFKLALAENPADFNLLKQTVLLSIDLKKFEEAKEISNEAMAYFPSQPLFYLLNGVALNNLNSHQEAEEMLLMGLDFLFDDPVMQEDFYEQLINAYKGMGKPEKVQEYTQQMQNLQK